MDFVRLASNLGLEEDEFLELVEILIDSADQDLARMQVGYEAGDLNAVAEAAHSLKGASGNLGFSELSEIARAIESGARGRELEELDASVTVLKERLDEIRNQLTTT